MPLKRKYWVMCLKPRFWKTTRLCYAALQTQHHVYAECSLYTCMILFRPMFICSLGNNMQTNPFSVCSREVGGSQDIYLFDEGLQFWICKGVKKCIRKCFLSQLSPGFCETLLLQICQHLCKTSDKIIRVAKSCRFYSRCLTKEVSCISWLISYSYWTCKCVSAPVVAPRDPILRWIALDGIVPFDTMSMTTIITVILAVLCLVSGASLSNPVLVVALNWPIMGQIEYTSVYTHPSKLSSEYTMSV